MDFLIVLVAVGGFCFVLASFTGGFVSAVAGGGREDNSLLENAAIGFLGWLLASAIWAVSTGSWPEELTPELLALTVACAFVVALVQVRRRRRRAG